MLKRYILISTFSTLSALFGSITAYAHNPLDSIGVENNNGKKLIIHKVDPKDNYYSISRRYNVNVKDLQSYNNNVTLQIGAIVKVPTELPFNDKPTAANSPTINATSFFDYTVAAKDNLNLIAERYATTVADIKKLNNLNGNNLQIGQVLKIPFTKSGTNVPVPSANPTATAPQTKPQETVTTTPNNITESVKSVTEHTVKPKEYLGVIAKQYGITVDELKAANDLTSNNLQIGQVLKIPAGAQTINKEPAEVIMMPPPGGTIGHEVKQQETLNTIAKKYNVSVDQIKQLNNLTTSNLTVGQVLIISKGEAEKPVESKPTPTKTTTPTPVNAQMSNKTEPTFEHIVANGETIYSIAQKYQLTTYQLKTYNNLTSNDLTVGQKLIIKGEKPATVANVGNTDNDEPSETPETLKNPNLRRPANVYGLNKVEEKGTAVWITDPDLDSSKMLILHRTAPVGTIMQITNPMTNRSTFAKVVGKFTENETTKDVIIVMTKAVADAVGALDKRFFCNLSYAQKENEK